MPKIITKQAPAKRPGQKSRRAMEREELVFYAVVVGCALTVLIHLLVQVGLSISAGRKYDRKEKFLEAGQALKVVEDEEQYAEEMKIVTSGQTEDRAAKKRAEEFEKRQNFDPAYAQSEQEKNLLEMKKLGESPEGSANEVLTKIAKLDSPPKSEVQIFENGARLDIAFPHKEAIKAAQKIFPKYPIYKAVRLTAAGILKDLMVLGAPRGVNRVTVRCQDFVSVTNATGEEKKEIRNLLVVSGTKAGTDWSKISRFEVEKFWQKQKDEYPSLIKEK